MSLTNTEVDQEALAWLIKTNDPDFTGWDDFTSWLEAGPTHALSYQRIAAAEQRVMPYVRQAVQLREDTRRNEYIPRSARRRTSSGRIIAALSGIAASVAAGIFFQVSRPERYETAPGETRTLALGDSDRLLLNGGTKVTVGGWDRRSIELQSGEILLVLREADAGPVRVQAGDLELVDVGTVFSVARSTGQTRVAVADGEVVVDPAGAKLRLARGMQLRSKDGQRLLRAERANPDAVGTWRFGHLAYTDAPLAEVVEDLTRATGLKFHLQKSITLTPFTGTLSVSAVKQDPSSLQALLGVPIRHSAGVWRLGDTRS